jgi:four helix bundle protein
MKRAGRLFMVARRLEELIVYQLGDELRTKVYELTATGRASTDRKFCDQIRDAASSVTRNTAEGFGRYRHKEFAQFFPIARGSVFEVRDQLRDGVKRKYWTREAISEAHGLCHRTIAAATRLIRYLRSHPDPQEAAP